MARGRVKVEDGTKRVRVYLGGIPVADTRAPKLVWERPWYPTYYFPPEDVRGELLVPTGDTTRSPSRGTAAVHTVKTDRATAEGAAFVWSEAAIEELAGYVSFDWDAMDHWFEEDEEVFVHARDPYTRVDVLQSSRHIEVRVAGVTVADSVRPRLLFETGLPVRYYLPKTDVRMDLLVPTDTVTRCPYKGEARYWSVVVDGEVHEDVVWGYDTPLLEAIGVAGFVSFYNEKVEIVVDGVLEERPRTMFS